MNQRQFVLKSGDHVLVLPFDQSSIDIHSSFKFIRRLAGRIASDRAKVPGSGQYNTAAAAIERLVLLVTQRLSAVFAVP